MSRIKIHNGTDQAITLEPGEELEIRGEKKKKRVLASRVQHFYIEDIGTRQE